MLPVSPSKNTFITEFSLKLDPPQSSLPNVRKSPRSGLNLEGRLSDSQVERGGAVVWRSGAIEFVLLRHRHIDPDTGQSILFSLLTETDHLSDDMRSITAPAASLVRLSEPIHSSRCRNTLVDI